MAVSLTTEQFVTFVVDPTDLRGRTAPVESLTAVSSDETVVTVEVVKGEGNAWNGTLTSVAPGGSAQVVLTGDADLGEGVKEVMAVIEEISVTLDERTAGRMLTVSLGEPQDKPL